MRRAVCLMLACAGSCVLTLSVSVEEAGAVAAFQTQFYKKYLADNEDADYVNLVKKEAKCWLCHQGKNRKNHNAYGIHLTKLLTKKDAKDIEKIQKALDEVAKLHCDPEDEKSKTYGELIAASELPGGPVEDCKKEPEGSDGENEEEEEKKAK